MLDGVEIGGTRTQGPGRYTPKIVRMGLALVPQGDACSRPDGAPEHLDSGAYTKRAWRERSSGASRCCGIFLPLAKLLTSRSASCPAASGAWWPGARR